MCIRFAISFFLLLLQGFIITRSVYTHTHFEYIKNLFKIA